MSKYTLTGARLTGIQPGADGLRVTISGHLVLPLPDLATASLAELREAEWSGREPCKVGDSAWHVCQCCGNAKIDGKGHKLGCTMAAAIVRSE